jgi:HTH-type transcriptional regulator/antitoxin HigA
MTTIKNEIEYNTIMQRIEELIKLTDDDTPKTDKNLIELDTLCGLVEEYENTLFPDVK